MTTGSTEYLKQRRRENDIQMDLGHEAARLINAGLMTPFSGGTQVNVQVAAGPETDGKATDLHLCDHNCRIHTVAPRTGEITLTGNYDCPAASSLNRGASVKKLTPGKQLMDGLDISVNGIQQFNIDFLASNEYALYCKCFQIPPDIQTAHTAILTRGNILINLFGGNPEMHPDIGMMLEHSKQKGYGVDLTTTGGRFMWDGKFLESVLRSPPNTIALSADDFESPGHIERIASHSLDEIYTAWKKIPQMLGQKRKAYEAIYTAKMAQDIKGFPPILFNAVVHRGNLHHIEQTIATLRELFPGVTVNPYLMQTAFEHKAPEFTLDNIPALEQFINLRTSEQMDPSAKVVKRPHYWLMHGAALEVHRDDPKRLLMTLAGDDIWTCFKDAGASRFLQQGKTNMPHSSKEYAGGMLSCFWNDSAVADDSGRQVWDMQPTDVAEYMRTGIMKASVSHNHIGDGCPGCAFPRLTFDHITTELGMSDSLQDEYLKLRKSHVGF